MLMAELSRSSGVPVATIKYYLREGLLPPGTATSATRAEYGEAHLRRLRLIRALVEIGEIPVAAIGHILAVVDDEAASLHVMLGAVDRKSTRLNSSHPSTSTLFPYTTLFRSIKYYLREGLLPPGTATSATRAEYGEAHLRRLRLIRALVEIGEIPVAAIGHILAVVDDEAASLHVMLGA